MKLSVISRSVSVIVLLFLVLLDTNYGKKVLVIGGTGRVGTKIVSELLHKGVDTNVLVRDLQSARCNPKLAGATLHSGDINSMPDILKASAGCDAIIAVHGPRPIRFSRLTDLFVHPRHDPQHPYSLYYLGTQRILAAMELNKIPKLVRLTGSLVGKNAFLPFVALFNLLLSGAVKWHERSEREIRASGVDYTVVRCPELLEEAPLALANSSTPQHLGVHSYDHLPSRLTTRTAVACADVASLCVRSLDSGPLARATVYCGKQPGPGPKSVEEALGVNEFGPDTRPLSPQAHSLSMLCYGAALSFLSFSLLKTLLAVSLSLSSFLFSFLSQLVERGRRKWGRVGRRVFEVVWRGKR